MSVDYILVGQGIAGSMLAWFLLKEGEKVLIVDEFNSNSASLVASGIINPVTGKRLVKSWRIDELLPFAKDTYRQLEKELGIHVFSEKTISRIFSNKEDSQIFCHKKELDELPDCVKPLNVIPSCFNNATLGGVEISVAYQLDYPVFLTAMKKFFLEGKMLLEEKLQFDKLELKNGIVSYKGIEASKIIFCEGNKARENPYFKWLPFNLAKGEVITVKMQGFPEEKIWHKAIFILPKGENMFRVGATYEWNFSDELPSEIRKKELAARLRKAVNLPFEILHHNAAIRPTVIDRRPLIGMHPYYDHLGVFNGLGTKGASLAPFFAHQFAMHLNKELPLDDEVNINRFSAEPFFPGTTERTVSKNEANRQS